MSGQFRGRKGGRRRVLNQEPFERREFLRFAELFIAGRRVSATFVPSLARMRKMRPKVCGRNANGNTVEKVHRRSSGP